MRSRALFLAASLTLLVGLPAPIVSALEPDPPDDPIVFAPQGLTQNRFPVATTPQWVDVQAHDGVMLASRVYRPDTTSDPDWKTPVIFVHSPYYTGLALPVTSIALPDAAKAQPTCGQPIRQPCRPDPRT